MTEARRNVYLAPLVDDESAHVLAALGERRGLCNGDASVRLHLLASVIAQADRCLPEAVAAARDQGCS